MKTAILRERFQQRLLVRPQSRQLVDQNGELAMDYVGRFENLQDSMDFIFDKLHLARVALKVSNSSRHAHYRGLYDGELRDQVAMFYQEDLLRFGYDF